MVVERHLLLIECKNAFHPCGVHELRRSYEQLRKARKQLDRLRQVLEREEDRRRLGRDLQWDLGEVDEIRTCVVTGNRIFNGYTIGQHPVRPVYELINMVVEGKIRVGRRGILRVEEITLRATGAVGLPRRFYHTHGSVRVVRGRSAHLYAGGYQIEHLDVRVEC